MDTDLCHVGIIANPELDNVAVAKRDLPGGAVLVWRDRRLSVRQTVPCGQRLALEDLPTGTLVRQYGHPFARSRGIPAGGLVSADSVEGLDPAHMPSESAASVPVPVWRGPTWGKEPVPTFLGYRRSDGRCGTRNYYVIIPTSMCASALAAQAARRLETIWHDLPDREHVDGIVALAHTEGCGCASNVQIDRLLLVLKGFLLHPNVGGCLLMDLGCEQTNRERVDRYLRDVLPAAGKPVDWVSIQAEGGSRKALERAVALGSSHLPLVARVRRASCPLSELVVGTECGASDSFSGITANPVMGAAADRVVAAGGSAILTEIPELLGIYEMLRPRFRDAAVAAKYVAAVAWYCDLAARLNVSMGDNVVPKNREGGLLNSVIKSLGAAMKGGTGIIEDVIDYGAPLARRGLHIMQGPGGDLESVTGLVASGANLICFSTGKGTITGDAVCPVIKMASTDDLARAMPEDMDFNAGRLLTDSVSVTALGDELLQLMLRVASGERTWSEKWGQHQFQIWTAEKLSL